MEPVCEFMREYAPSDRVDTALVSHLDRCAVCPGEVVLVDRQAAALPRVRNT